MSNYKREGSIRPPIFDGSNFVYWKVRTTTYLQSLGTDVREIVEGGYTFPSIIPTYTAGKKKYETNAKVVNTLLRSLSKSEFVKVMQLKTAKEIWDKIVLSYEGDNQNLGEEIKEVTLVEKVSRSLSTKFESKVSAIEEKQDLQTITMTQLHGILTAFKMRKGGPSDIREATFKASGREEINESGHISEGEEETNFVKNLERGSGRFRDTLTFQLAEREKHNEKLECEIVGLRKDIEKTKALNLRFTKGLETLNEMIKVQRSPLIKTGVGYTEEASQAQKLSTSTKSYLDAAKSNGQFGNQQQRHKVDHQVNQAQLTSRMNRSYKPEVNHTQSASRMSINSNYNHQKEKASLNPKIWRNKEPETKRGGIALYAEGQENHWYINNGCSKHMTGDKEKLQSYNALEKEKKVSFGNDTPAVIKGKGFVLLKEKVKAGNVMYVDGLKHNLLSVSQMCDQGNEVVFRSNGCVVHELDTG
eukprot:PITA_07385